MSAKVSINAKLKGRMKWELLRPDGSLQWKGDFPNGVTTPGKNDLLDKYFENGTTATAWYLGLINGASFTELAAADTMASHAGWIEMTDYSNATRPAWGPDAAASGSKTNSTAVEFTFTADGSIRGGFLTTVNTKSGTTGILYCTAIRSSNLAVTNGSVLRVVYTTSLT